MKHKKVSFLKENGEFSLSLLSFGIVHVKKSKEHKRSVNYY
ncbi:cell filamentation protein Fic, partial [Salmonella enterica]|nr:cell filamentation protein Fic [Salmonella enterica]